MKITINEIQTILTNPSIKTFLTRKLPAEVAFKLAKLYNTLNTQYDIFKRQKDWLFNTYAEKDENGTILVKNNNIQIKPDLITEFNERVKELLSTECDLGIDKVKLNLKDVPKITSVEANAVLPLVELFL